METSDCNDNECGSFDCCQYITLSRLVFVELRLEHLKILFSIEVLSVIVHKQ